MIIAALILTCHLEVLIPPDWVELPEMKKTITIDKYPFSESFYNYNIGYTIINPSKEFFFTDLRLIDEDMTIAARGSEVGVISGTKWYKMGDKQIAGAKVWCK